MEIDVICMSLRHPRKCITFTDTATYLGSMRGANVETANVGSFSSLGECEGKFGWHTVSCWVETERGGCIYSLWVMSAFCARITEWEEVFELLLRQIILASSRPSCEDGPSVSSRSTQRFERSDVWLSSSEGCSREVGEHTSIIG